MREATERNLISSPAGRLPTLAFACCDAWLETPAAPSCLCARPKLKKREQCACSGVAQMGEGWHMWGRKGDKLEKIPPKS